jgi:hypothetical protein
MRHAGFDIRPTKFAWLCGTRWCNKVSPSAHVEQQQQQQLGGTLLGKKESLRVHDDDDAPNVAS